MNLPQHVIKGKTGKYYLTNPRMPKSLKGRYELPQAVVDVMLAVDEANKAIARAFAQGLDIEADIEYMKIGLVVPEMVYPDQERMKRPNPRAPVLPFPKQSA